MKTTLFALVVIVLQTVYCHSVEETTASMQQALENCAASLHLNKDDMITANNQVLLSEDDADIQKMFACYAKETGMLDSNNQLVYDKIRDVVEARILKLTSGAPNGAEKAHDLAVAAVEFCKDIPADLGIEIIAIKMRNCIRSYIAKPQLLTY